MKKITYVFYRFSGAGGLGRIGGTFKMINSKYKCFATKNPKDAGWVKTSEKGFWKLNCKAENIV